MSQTTPAPAPITDPIALADELERLLLEVANGERKPKDLPLEPFVRAHQKLRELAKAAERITGLRRLCGYVENGSDTPVSIFQDDATREWFVRVGAPRAGKMPFHGSSMTAALDAAITGTPKEEWED